MTKRGTSLLEMLLATALLLLCSLTVLSGISVVNRQSIRTSDSLACTQDALFLMDDIRLELQSMVLNPLSDLASLKGNSFILSEPNGTSIQFITRKMVCQTVQLYLVYYEASDYTPGKSDGGLRMRKMVWKFNQTEPWTNPITFPAGWPASWVGPLVSSQDTKYDHLDLVDMRWIFKIPEQPDGHVYFQVQMAVKPAGSPILPFEALVAVPVPVPVPDLPPAESDTQVSDANGFHFRSLECATQENGGMA